jgi:hypothetical protein
MADFDIEAERSDAFVPDCMSHEDGPFLPHSLLKSVTLWVRIGLFSKPSSGFTEI